MTDLDKLIEKCGSELRSKISRDVSLPDQNPSGGVTKVGDLGEYIAYPATDRTPEQIEAFRGMAADVVAEFCRNPGEYLAEIAPATDPRLDVSGFLAS